MEITDEKKLEAFQAIGKILSPFDHETRRSICDSVVRFMQLMQPNKMIPVLNLESVEAFLSIKSKRILELAYHFKTSESEIKRVLSDPKSRIVRVDRGWLKLKPEETDGKIDDND